MEAELVICTRTIMVTQTANMWKNDLLKIQSMHEKHERKCEKLIADHFFMLHKKCNRNMKKENIMASIDLR